MHVNLALGVASDGTTSFEPIHATYLGKSRYRVEFTPGLVYGIAAGDEIELGVAGEFKVVLRAGNIAVRVFSSESLREIEGELTAQIEAIGGRLDGMIMRGLAYTISYAAGFNAIERIFTVFIQKNPKAFWEYGNVYTEDGVPLNWWQTVL